MSFWSLATARKTAPEPGTKPDNFCAKTLNYLALQTVAHLRRHFRAGITFYFF
jgi:hypothetical protein